MKKTKKGFTLVELLLVIAIIGILAAVLFVSLGKQRERARMTTFKENMRGLVTAATACRDAGGTVLAVQGAAVCNPTNDIGNIPNIGDCDGDGNIPAATFTVSDASADDWAYSAVCTKSTGTCDAACDVNGCTFTGCE